MKHSILAALCCLPLSMFAQKSFTIKGKIGTLNAPAKVYLSYKHEGKKILDSIAPKNGVFTFSGKLNQPVEAELTAEHDDKPKPKFSYTDYLSFFLENSTVTVTTKDSLNHAVVKGSATNEEQKVLWSMQRPYKRSADSLMAVYNKMTPKEREDSIWRRDAGAIMRVTQAGYDSITRVFMNKYPNSFITLLNFNQLDLAYNFNPDSAAVRYAKLPAHLRNTYTGKKLWEIIETGKKTNMGAVAMDFTQNDSTGKAVSLSDFRGKYVLIDFWASWCKPCRAENPVMLAAYNKFKDKNFTILGVSLDGKESRRAWLYAVNQDKLPWTQISELNGFESKAAVMYGISAIPANFLVDPNGKIIGRNLRGEDLNKKLEELFPM